VTLYVSLRVDKVGGPTRTWPIVQVGAGGNLSLSDHGTLRQQAQGRDVVFAIHGFNVNQADGAGSLHRLDLTITQANPGTLVVGVLWPGDYWIPVVNYPWEASDAVNCGRTLAQYIDLNLKGARSVSFVTHSLGGRVGLAAAQALPRRVRTLCVTAAAVDDCCLSTSQYQDVLDKTDHVAVLASRKDKVLRVAYPLGDFFSDLFGDRDSPFRGALGFHGPAPRPLPGVVHRQIPEDAGSARRGYDHGDYLPPANPSSPETNWQQVAAFMADSLAGRTPRVP
jgi:pimeloyl-ACP methyl ester carboxylesterase